jgi:hypothetical protein
MLCCRGSGEDATADGENKGGAKTLLVQKDIRSSFFQSNSIADLARAIRRLSNGLKGISVALSQFFV